MIDIISLGAGVQSSVMALMAEAGELPKPVAAVFADTKAEPKSVYLWLDWLEKQLSFPVVRATAGDLAEASTRLRTSKKTGNIYLSPTLPVFTTIGGKKGMLGRQCTRDYKVNVVRRASRVIMRQHNAKTCRQWIGISTDEAIRMKPSTNTRFENMWPLIEKNMSRVDCLSWAKARGMPEPPRSSCSFCPYHSDKEWIRLRDEEPEAFADAVAYERKLSESVRRSSFKVDAAYLHSSRVPLDQVMFGEVEGADQFINECEGMCGV